MIQRICGLAFGPTQSRPLKAVSAGIAVHLILLYGASSSTAGENPKVPPQAAAAGYLTKTFSSTFSKESIDLYNTGRSGFAWYPSHFFGQQPSRPESVQINPGDGIELGAGDLAASFETAAPARTASRWVGVAFGGGAYFEATLKFDPARTAQPNRRKAWPAFWSLAIEHAASLGGQQWPGELPGYTHFIEADFFEYDVWAFSPRHYYGGAMHDWFGIYNKTCPGSSFCGVSNAGRGGTRFTNFVVKTPQTTDYTRFHRFGFLWVPATSTRQGYAQYYFDGIATDDRVTWDKYTDQPPPPGQSPWTFGIIDKQHLVLILTTGIGQPMTVRSVVVWQATADNNLIQYALI